MSLLKNQCYGCWFFVAIAWVGVIFILYCHRRLGFNAERKKKHEESVDCAFGGPVKGSFITSL